MNREFFQKDADDPTRTDKHPLVAVSERPTKNQLRYYFQKAYRNEPTRIARIGARLYENDERLLLSDAKFRLYGSGDMFVVDAHELDLSLVAKNDPSRCVGRGILYSVMDAYSRYVLAYYVSLDNNSKMALSSVMARLINDFGILPRRIHMDNGSDFASKEFTDICRKLGITMEFDPPKLPSWNGLIENLHHEIEDALKPYILNEGLITKEYGSDHHRKACLTVEDCSGIVGDIIDTHNSKVMTGYDEGHNKALLDAGIMAIPEKLWAFGMKFGCGRAVTDKKHVIYNLLTSDKASVSRHGICFKGLYYIVAENADATLFADMASGHTSHLSIKYDPREIGHIYYQRGDKIITACLNIAKSGTASFAQAPMTVAEYESYRTLMKEVAAKAKEHNENLDAALGNKIVPVVDNARKRNHACTKNISQHRQEEKYRVQRENTIGGMIDPGDDTSSPGGNGMAAGSASTQTVSRGTFPAGGVPGERDTGPDDTMDWGNTGPDDVPDTGGLFDDGYDDVEAAIQSALQGEEDDIWAG